jgi:hypothetical protein
VNRDVTMQAGRERVAEEVAPPDALGAAGPHPRLGIIVSV